MCSIHAAAFIEGNQASKTRKVDSLSGVTPPVPSSLFGATPSVPTNFPWGCLWPGVFVLCRPSLSAA